MGNLKHTYIFFLPNEFQAKKRSWAGSSVACPLREREVMGLILGHKIKNGTSCSSLGTKACRVELGLFDQCQDNVIVCHGIMSSVLGMILQ